MDPVDNPRASLNGPIEAIPVDDASFDVVLCAQVLEHCRRPGAGRPRAPPRDRARAGACSLSTHGVDGVPPVPRRPTGAGRRAGLERLFRENGDWAFGYGVAGSGTTACLAMLIAIYLEHVLRRTPLRAGARAGRLGAQPRSRGHSTGALRSLRDERPGHARRQLPRRRRGAA